MVKLPVPYRSQWDVNDAGEHSTDCGPTCVAMIVNYRGVAMTPNGVYAYFAQAKGRDDYTNFNELILAARDMGVKLNYRKYNDVGEEAAFRNLRANLDAGSPVLALVKYLPWKSALGNELSGGHFVAVTGSNADHIHVHHPLFGLQVKPAEYGPHYS